MNSQDRDILPELLERSTRDAVFPIMIKRYQEPLYRHVRRLTGNHPDADDALQNTFIKAWKGLDGFKGESALYTWLYRIAANEAIAILRARRPDHVGINLIPMDKNSQSGGPDGDEIAAKLTEALSTLPPKQRQVFDLKYFEEMQYDEIAEITGTSVGALKASYFHAVRKIEAFLADRD